MPNRQSQILCTCVEPRNEAVSLQLIAEATFQAPVVCSQMSEDFKADLQNDFSRFQSCFTD